MPTYNEIMTTDLSQLTTVANAWDAMAAKFDRLERQYKKDVHGLTVRPSWVGLSAQAAGKRFDATRREYQAAQTEAKAVASLLRDAYDVFADLRDRLKTTRDAAVDQGLKVSGRGIVTFDFDKLNDSERNAYAHDRSYQQAVAARVGEWAEAIDRVVKAVTEADNRVKIALETAVVDSNVHDGVGFNARAEGDLDKVKPETAADTGTRSNGWRPDVGASATGVGYGKQGMAKAYVDVGHATKEGSVAYGPLKLSGIGDSYAGGRASASAGIGDSGISGTAEVSGGARGLAEGRVGFGPFSPYGRATGFAGGEAGVNAGVGSDGVGIGGEAFGGAKGSVTKGTETAGVGFGVTAEGWVGPGAEVGLFSKDDDGKYHFGAKVGVSPIIGGAVGFEFTVDPDKVADAAGGAADALGDGVDAGKRFVGSVKDGIGGLL
ncbi:hypothetical protein GCM10012286_04420 [Streptomyces lasiicapitis]|uniref:WXG100 family type VII secretion target n=2 Tax=Streptomyces lasiicapitis TaxID=1923961 RepID=A0ABQ2LHZ1_9ACTN|nr:hypothetical protein GCM10012286_04420 [Streptomyces lasiicapitis]